jgi:lipoprotein signal peptidase
MQRSNSGVFWPVLVLVAAVDFCTKALAVSRLIPQRLPHDVYGDIVRFTLVYKPGAALGHNNGRY